MEAGAFEERSLVERAKRDPDAFAALYDRYFSRVHAFAYRRLGSKAAAEDVTAETFTRALAGLPGFRWRNGGFGAWLFRIARNLSVDYLRRQAATAPLPDEEALDGRMPAALGTTPEGDVEEAAVTADLVSRLKVLVARLPGPQREVILLKYGSGLDNREIAVATGRSPTAVSSLVFRVTHKLREELDLGRA